jgi:hypothetical protein
MKEFCGTDDICHDFSCENWYLYGNERFTRHNNIAAPTLECQEIAPDGNNLYQGTAGIFYGCNSTTPIRQNFNRECIANINEKTNFVCREFGPETDFQSFIDDADNSTTTCESGSPIYTYLSWLGFNTYLGVSSSSSPTFSSQFGKSLAMKTIYSYLNSTEKPSDNTIPAPEDPNASSEIKLGVNVYVWTGAVFVFALIVA